MAIYKELEFDAFITLIEKGHVHHWQQIAEVLAVDKNTITAWKKHPEARQALIKGITNALDNMEKVGGKDWRMWQAKLNMLGISDKVEVRAEIQPDPVEEILKRYGLLDENGQRVDLE